MIVHGRSKVLHLIALSHFTAMFVAFSVPPFFATILATSFHGEGGILGLCYATPAIAAIAAYYWRAKLPHIIGERNALIASHLGMSISLAMTGLAGTVWQFLAGLALQGLVAPTFATSSSYLASCLKGNSLVNGIGSLQFTTRIASAFGPALLGVVIVGTAEPLHIYKILAGLTLCSAMLLMSVLPQRHLDQADNGVGSHRQMGSPPATHFPYLSQILLLFSVSATAPNFIAYLQTCQQGVPEHLLGTIFAIPSFAYLMLAPFTFRFKQFDAHLLLSIGFVGLALGFIGQWITQSWEMVAGFRFLSGGAMLCALGAINIFLVRVAEVGNASTTFSRFELSGRSAMAAGAILGDMVASNSGLRMPFLMSAVVMGLASLWVGLGYSRR